uniref:Uncharacterized protein n=1 Tax=Heterorhabditis bacteriophora TaxID=37862 RepID=A0A1I7WI10_HETBA
MSSSGPQWSLYPLLAIIAFVCLLFIINKIYYEKLLSESKGNNLYMYIYVRVFNYCQFTRFSQIDFLDSDENMKEGICYGFKYRTIALVGSCMDFLGTMQMSFMTKIGWKVKDRDSIRFFISCCLSVLSGIHLSCTTVLTFYSAIETK